MRKTLCLLLLVAVLLPLVAQERKNQVSDLRNRRIAQTTSNPAQNRISNTLTAATTDVLVPKRKNQVSNADARRGAQTTLTLVQNRIILNTSTAATASVLLQEGFESGSIPTSWTLVDADGDGHNWGVTTTVSGNFVAYSESYNNSIGELEPNNWMISPAISVPSQDATVLTYEVAVFDPNYPADHYGVFISTTPGDLSSFTLLFEETLQAVHGTPSFRTVEIPASYAGQTVHIAFRHFNCVDEYVMYIDNISVQSGNSIFLSSDNVTFPVIALGSDITAPITVTGFGLTESITVTTAAPFEVSADNTAFAATATLPAAGGSLYVKYTPASEGPDNGTVTLTSGTVTETVTLTGNAMDCTVAALPYLEPFNQLTCWTLFDADGDGFNWGLGALSETNTVAYSASYNPGALTPDNWMISPAIPIPSQNVTVLTYDVATTDPDYPSEHYGVYISTTPGDLSSFTLLFEETLQAEHVTEIARAVEIPASYAGQTVHIAFRHFNCTDQSLMYIDNVLIQDTTSILLTSVEEITYPLVVLGSSAVSNSVTVNGFGLTDDIAITATAPFEISTDNTTFAATATLPATGGNLYVKYTPVSEGSDNGTVTLTGGIHTKTITVSGTSINCTVDALPYQETFTGTLDCWTLVDADQDGLNWGLGEGYAASESFYFIFALTPDNWMISPALPVPAQGPTSVSWEVTVADPDFSAEHYGLFISTNRDDLQSYTSLFEETLTSDEVDWTSREVTLPESYAGQTVYIAFRHFDCTDQSLMALRNVEVASTVGISSLPAQVTHIYPNPATDRVNVSTKLCQTAEVIDMMGRTVITVKPNNTQFEINVAGLKSGLYAIRLTHEGGISTSKFIKR